MIEPKPLICQSCGAPINRQTLKCDYCGTEYERENNGVMINYVVERPGIHKINAKVSLNDEIILHTPEAAQEFVLRKMRDEIAEGLLVT